jgi:DNA adenine methylase
LPTPKPKVAPSQPTRILLARPILKWAGGKGQLLERFSPYFPKALADGKIHTYIEPFMGGGAVFFYVIQNFPIQFAFLRDANPELVLLYQVVQREPEKLISLLGQMERGYLKLDEEGRKERFLKVRGEFNHGLTSLNLQTFSVRWIERAAQTIFLNKTCYNGLFRVNSRGIFNVPFGRYAKPRILDAENLTQASRLLAKADISLGDFGEIQKKANKIKPGVFIYYDPPYRPISRTASFTAYSREAFGDEEQKRLAKLFGDLNRPGVYQMLSNSDPKNTDPTDNFFEEQYSDFLNRFFRIPASRSINSKGSGRGLINELIICNYKV